MQVAFDGVGSMPMQRIRDVREVKQAVVDTEMERRERRQELRRSLSVPRVSSTDSVPLPSEGALLPSYLLEMQHMLSSSNASMSLMSLQIPNPRFTFAVLALIY